MRKYRLVAKKGEGTFSEVLKAQNVKDGKYYAIKCMKNRFDSIDQVRLIDFDSVRQAVVVVVCETKKKLPTESSERVGLG